MGDELGDLRTQVLEQAIAIDELKQTAAEAEERRSKYHAELLGLMEQLLNRSEAQADPGGQLQQESLPAAGAVGRAAASPSSGGGPDDDSGSRGGTRVPAEAEPRGQKRGVAPHGESSLSSVGLGARRFLVGQPKMAVPVLEGRGNFEVFSKQMRVYTKLQGIESVFDTDAYIDVGAYGNDKESFMAQGVSESTYEKQLMAWVFLSQALESSVDKARFHRSTSPRRCWEETMDWYDTKTNAQKGMCMRELYNFTIGKEDNPVERLYAIEDLREKLVNAGMSVDDNTLYSCFVNALPAAEYMHSRYGI
ncbi:unnamed protein product [Laminaria digitata]